MVAGIADFGSLKRAHVQEIEDSPVKKKAKKQQNDGDDDDDDTDDDAGRDRVKSRKFFKAMKSDCCLCFMCTQVHSYMWYSYDQIV